jgi:penicillin-binding protein 2
MRRGQISYGLVFLAGVMLLALGGIVFRLWYVQIARGADYTAKIASGSRVTVRIPAVRGEILDRNAIPLVQNRSSFDVDFYLPDMVRAYRDGNGSIPYVTYRGSVHNMPKDMKEADVARIVSETIIPRLEDLGVAQDYNAQRLQIHFRNNQEVPFSYMQDLNFDKMAVLSERNLGLPGVDVTKKPVRQYVYGALGAHFLGYVGMPNDLSTLPDINKFKFYDPDMEGKAQIELYMNNYLKGTPGVKILQRDAKGVIKQDDVQIVEPKQGANVYLTIDARVQYIVEKALRTVGRAAAVVVDPNNGDILAMASVPSYDPNKFIPSIAAKDWKELNNDETNPLLNRAISAYAPGSTYKIPIALAGLRAGVGDRSFNCSGGVSYGNTYMKCWIASKGGSHGTQNLSTAIKNSCNAFFYQYGNAAGIDQIVAMGNMLGLGQKTGIPLSGEAPGILPGPEYLAQVSPKERWSSGYTANTSIGQGMVLASPIQMAMIVATVANGGICYYPRMIDKVVAQDGTVLLQEPSKVRSNLVTEGGLTPEQIEKVRNGMRRVVNEAGGTAGRARIKGMEVAGKTGTAQFMRSGVKDNHTWFIAFAPYDKPKYAVCVIVQGGKSGGGVAAPIAAEILEKSFALDKEPAEGEEKKPAELAWLDPAKGNFNAVESVDFDRDIPAATTIAADEETGGAASASQGSQENRPEAPNVRDDADAGGRVKNKERKPSAIDKFFNIFRGGNKDKKEKSKPPSGRR